MSGKSRAEIRSFILVLGSCLLLISASRAILIGPPSGSVSRGEPVDSNSTFYYEPSAFLINRRQDSNLAPTEEDKNSPNKQAENAATAAQAANKSQTISSDAAPTSMVSARNGRMLDLDALVGDFAASKATRERSMAAGNRQSRFLQPTNSVGGAANLDIGGGKRLHIQGFIPIVGVKDDQDELEEGQSGEQATVAASKFRPKVSQTAQSDHLLQSYGPSTSSGHATFGVQRYLNTEHQPQQVDAKFSGGAAASMVDSLVKRPIKKLTSLASGGGVEQSNCLCVPFYMCKNGFISESSLGKSQIQQMILQQQMQQVQVQTMQQPRQIVDNLDALKRGSAESVPVNGGQSYANSLVPVDERSMERDIITMAPLTADATGQLAASNQSADQSSGTSELVVSATSSLNPPEQSAQFHEDGQQFANETATNSDFAQDILGRMLGLKGVGAGVGQQQYSASAQKVSHSPGGAGGGGVCGLLRSCCSIPSHLFPSQQDLANERLMAQYMAAGAQPAKFLPNKLGAPTNQQQDLMQQQRFQMASSSLVPYGLPASAQQVARIVAQPQLGNQLDVQSSSILAHRTNQYPAARYGLPAAASAGSQVAQFQRGSAPQSMQAMQSVASAARQSALYQKSAQLQQQQQQMQQMQLMQLQQAQQTPFANSAAANYLNPPAATRNNNNNGLLLGTRKLLDGRCGLRQSAGITGRVQNLQYSENSAEFGEFPAQAAILKRLNGTESLFVCGGTLISQYWLATAAHCIRRHSQSELKIRLGEWDVHRDDEFYPFVEKEVRDIVIHPDFVPGNLINDLALVRLDSQIDPSLPHINPACLPTFDDQFSRQKCSVTGWGKDSFGRAGSFQSVLQKVELPVLGHSECESSLRQTKLGPHYRLHSGFVCAGGEGGKDACEGDGGSGLYCVQDGVIKVAGLVSWGIGCGQAGVPGVYVNIAHYRPWIENIISIDEDIYSSYNNLIGGGSSLISERSNSNTTTDNKQLAPAPAAEATSEPNTPTTISPTTTTPQ